MQKITSAFNWKFVYDNVSAIIVEITKKRQIQLVMSEKFTTLQAEVCSYRIAATIPCCMPTTISRAL